MCVYTAISSSITSDPLPFIMPTSMICMCTELSGLLPQLPVCTALGDGMIVGWDNNVNPLPSHDPLLLSVIRVGTLTGKKKAILL